MSEVITAINAKPETVKSFLGNYEYVIPDYQRPYSWGKDECIRLWEDLTTYYDEGKTLNSGSPYFLGNVVIYNGGKKRFVVDGQQRLITLNLLIRALFTKCQSYTVLERILYKNDPLTGEVKQPYEIKVEHNVLGEDENKKLKNAILNNEIESNYRDNYEIFVEQIDSYFNLRSFDSSQIQDFVLTLIDNVVVLPIECTDFESALTIFETINNRGMDLSDSDIFKSKLYKYSSDKKDSFILRWNELVQSVEKANLDLKDVFSHFMHVLRGKEKNVDSIVGLRKFYDQNSSSRLRDWESVMDSLDKLAWGWYYITNEDSKASIEVLNWCSVLCYYPNSYWEYPIMTFMHENIYKEDDEFKFKSDTDLVELLKETARYCYWKWLKYRGVNAIKDTIFKIVREVANDGDYKKVYSDDIATDFKDGNKSGMQNSLKSILSSDLGRGLKGVCLLNAVLNEQQERLIPKDFQMEHILPQKWEHYKYSGWNNSLYHQYHDMLGNLVPLEKKLNIKSSHRFFAEKKIYYSQSNIRDVRDLGSHHDWTPTEFKERQKTTTERLTKFLNE